MSKKMSLSKWWNENSVYVYIISVVFIFILLLMVRYFFPEWFDEKVDVNLNTEIDNTLFAYRTLDVPSKRVRGESKGEKICKEVAERLFNRPFIKIRPNFLKNDRTGNNLELDVYNDELKLAIEYNGIQHYKYVPHFHRKGQEDFEAQKYRDAFKEEKCRENGISLITVPYLIKHHEIEGFIKLKAKELNLL